MEIIGQNKAVPSFGNSYQTGWNVMKKYFLILFLAVIVVALVTSPSQIFRLGMHPHHFHNFHNMHDWNFHIPDMGLLALGFMAVMAAMFALAYTLLIVPIFRYGGRMMFIQAVRDIRPDFNLLIRGFRENYLGIVLASLLTMALVMIGIFALVIPGIIIGCRLAFVGYLVMDKKLDPIRAVEESWKLTRGHGWTIFWMAVVAFFICIAGFCLLFVGIFPAIMWISSSFASLYDSVLAEKNA